MPVIDWRSVEFAVTGARMHLTPTEKQMVVRRLSHRLLRRGDNTVSLKPGQMTVTMVAERLGCTERHIERVIRELPAADEQDCPICGCRMWIHTDGLVEAHPDSMDAQCPLSNYELPTVSGEDLTALQAVWLAEWMRIDPLGVRAHLSALGRGCRDRLLSAALAAIPSGVDPAKLFGWQEQIA